MAELRAARVELDEVRDRRRAIDDEVEAAETGEPEPLHQEAGRLQDGRAVDDPDDHGGPRLPLDEQHLDAHGTQHPPARAGQHHVRRVTVHEPLHGHGRRGRVPPGPQRQGLAVDDRALERGRQRHPLRQHPESLHRLLGRADDSHPLASRAAVDLEHRLGTEAVEPSGELVLRPDGRGLRDRDAELDGERQQVVPAPHHIVHARVAERGLDERAPLGSRSVQTVQLPHNFVVARDNLCRLLDLEGPLQRGERAQGPVGVRPPRAGDVSQRMPERAQRRGVNAALDEA